MERWKQPCLLRLQELVYLMLEQLRLLYPQTAPTSRPQRGAPPSPSVMFMTASARASTARHLQGNPPAGQAHGSAPAASDASPPLRTSAPSARAPSAARGPPTSSTAPGGEASGRRGPRSPHRPAHL